MPDVNERIVQRYFELEGYMVTANIKYMITKGSSGESDIDLAIFRAKPLDRAIVEVKGWHTETFSMSYFNSDGRGDYRARMLNFVKTEALKAAGEFFHAKDFRRILVVPELSPKQKDKIARMLKEKHGVDVLEFSEVLKEVIAKTEINKNYRDSEFQQTIRLLKAYEFIK